ncbi:MAG: hypothetical protein KAV82_05545 [Phycisphaerae bacterium]|nr:hypothetical protein [Phycisphaerae bacterium]
MIITNRFPNRYHGLAVAVLICLGSLICPPRVQAERLHFTYLWHLEQPIYWPDQQASGQDRYERAWESIQRTDGGAQHPENNLRDIFGWPDRVAAYQYRCRDSISAISWAAEAGAQISYSGGLIENIQSLGNANQLGYSPTWYAGLREARGWNTVGQSKPRCEMVIIPFHHPLLPLCDESTVRKEIQLYKAFYAETWGSSPGISKGLFPPEIAFSERLIEVLVAEGIEWVIVSGEHVSRACGNFPVVYGSGGINCDPPNPADQINPAQEHWFRKHIDRGCSPCTAYPFGYTPHRAQYVDPQTGAISEIIVVPAAQALGWDNGYAAMGLSQFDTLDAHNPPSRPMLVLMAHDGDNAWGGGYSYYMEATPNLVSQAEGVGYTATVVEEYLADHPVPADDLVHVEDGAWVNADGDFGSPIMLNWNWPLVNGAGQIDIPNGWAEDERNWAVITAAQNRVDTAEQIAGGVNINKILHPDGTTSAAERAWHYFLASLNSGYMYYGTSLDMEVKTTIACNEAMEHADWVIGDGSQDTTAPTIWIPQRHPWNPGSENFGPQYGYTVHHSNGDFWVWTFVYDVSGVTSVTLKYRIDADNANPLSSTQNETYAGGAEVGAWQSLPMNYRAFPTGNFHGDPSIDFFELPAYIADEYYVQVTGLREVLIDYYVEAADGKGYVRKSPIQHVYIGDGSGSGPGDAVEIDPDPAVAGQDVTISYNPVGRVLAGAPQVYLHYGFNGWNPVVSPDPAMTWNAQDEVWEITVAVLSSATQLDMVFNDGAGAWDNNGGQDWHFTVTGGQPPENEWEMDGALDAAATLVASNSGMELYVGVIDDVLYVATADAGEGNDHFVFLANPPGYMRGHPWAKAGTVADWDAYLGNENDSDWSGWFDAGAGAGSATGGGSGYLEGIVSLTEEFGAVPTEVYLAVALYPTGDGSSLLWEYQVPPSVNSDGNVDPEEYIVVNVCDVRVDKLPTDFDQDCDVDLADLAIFTNCLNGPQAGSAGTCPPGVDADLDDDGDVDLADFAAFAQEYAG